MDKDNGDRLIAFVNEAFSLIKDVHKYADETREPLTEALRERLDHFECYYADWVKSLSEAQAGEPEPELYEVGSATNEYLPPYPLSVQRYPYLERMRTRATGEVHEWPRIGELLREPPSLFEPILPDLSGKHPEDAVLRLRPVGEPLQAVSTVIELKSDKKYLLVFKGVTRNQLYNLLEQLRTHSVDCLGIALSDGQTMEVIEVPVAESEHKA